MLPYYSVPYAVPTSPVGVFPDPTATTILALRCVVAPPPPPSPPASPPPPPSPPSPPPPPPVVVPGGIPPAAAAAGFTARTFHTGPFNPSNTDVADEPQAAYQPGMQWYFTQPFYAPDSCVNASCVKFNADGSITLTNTAFNLFRVKPGQQTLGVGFGGGAYFEAVMSFDGALVRVGLAPPMFSADVLRACRLTAFTRRPRSHTWCVTNGVVGVASSDAAASSCKAWPAFGCNSLEFSAWADPCPLLHHNAHTVTYPSTVSYGSGSSAVTRYVEFDFFEAYGATSTFIDRFLCTDRLCRKVIGDTQNYYGASS